MANHIGQSGMRLKWNESEMSQIGRYCLWYNHVIAALDCIE